MCRPRSEGYLGDPTHVRPITPMVLSLFNKENCRKWQEMNFSKSPLAIYHDVDFEVSNTVVGLSERYKNLWDRKLISRDEISQSIAEKQRGR